jgi:hypothetical protein
LPAVEGKGRLPSILNLRLVPAANRVVVQIQELGDLRTTLALVQKQNRICPPRDPMLLDLATHTALKCMALFEGKGVTLDHDRN